MTPEICPICGAEVPSKAKACPKCGADEETGWSERARSQELGLPDEDFNYDEFIKEEFGQPKQTIAPLGIGWMWWLVAVVLLAAFLLFWVLRV